MPPSTAARYPRSVAVEAPGLRMTFAQLDEHNDALARDLMRRGIGHGATVGALLLDGASCRRTAQFPRDPFCLRCIVVPPRGLDRDATVQLVTAES